MATLRARIVDIVERNLEILVDASMSAYVREIPSVATASAKQLRTVRAATTRAMRAFLEMYRDPETPPQPYLDQARAATIERAGEIVDRDDIVAMIRIGRRAIVDAARSAVQDELAIPRPQREELEEELDAFVQELERADEKVATVTPDVLTRWLSRAELDEPDLE